MTGHRYATAAGQLAFLELTCLPIRVTTFVADIAATRLDGKSSPVGIIAVATSGVLWRLLRAARHE